MYLYLVRHGEAVEPFLDPKRPLSEFGEQEAECLGAQLARAGIVVNDIWHSEYLRAEQTAARLAPHLQCNALRMYPHLSPGDPVDPVAETVRYLDEDLMLVGHLPFMGLLTSLLLTGDAEKLGTVFDTATVVCIEIHIDQTRLCWMLPAALLSPNG